MRTVTGVAVVVALVALGCDRASVTGALLRDVDGHAYDVREMPDGRTWMTDNLALERSGSWCYDNDDSRCDSFGRLYTWSAAVSACRQLGATWGLPTDDEWQELAEAFGGVFGYPDDGETAYEELVEGGESGFEALLGGGREADGDFARIDEHGFYWTATEYDRDHAWFYNFGRDAAILNRHASGEKTMALAVRCIDAF